MAEPAKRPAGEDAGSAEEFAAARLVLESGIAWLHLDDPAKKVNTLSSRFMGWFEAQLERLAAERPRGLVILSDKAENFIAGADIDEIKALHDPPAVRQLLARGHAMMQRLNALPFPVVAAIHGSCLGGGLELSLACHVRLATEHPKTRLGLPEVQIGIFPGLGGSQRLPRLIGVPDALDLILTGRQVDAKKARRLGLVDETCHPADLAKVARALVERGIGKDRRLKGWRPPAAPLGKKIASTLAGLPLLKGIVYNQARKTVLKKTGGHYPAPLKALEVVRKGMTLPLPRALELEARVFSELVVTDEAKRLMGIFFMKNEVDGRAAALAKQARPVPRIGVLGAGFMGSGIAQVLAHRGYPVLLKDRDHAAVGRGLKHCRDLFQEMVQRRRYTPMELTLAMSRIQGVTDYHGFKQVDFVIEAVFEDVAVKHQVIREAEAAGPENLIFASNTSTLPITRLAEGSARPQNVIGMHFFSPVHKMPLLEIIRHPGTSDEAVATTVQVGLKMGKTVIVVNDGPGFFTSRVLGPFINEAAWLLTEGASIADIDRALTRWGWPVGPITLLDEVGIDIAAHASETMLGAFGERMQPPPVFERLLADGRTGRKGKKGFYRYSDSGKKLEVDESVYALIGWQPAKVAEEEIVERCWLQMLNEVAHCIEDGIIENPVDIDIGVIFGFGFPPFRSGILREADRLGLAHVVGRLEAHAAKHGSRLAPAQLLRDMAARGERFHK